MTYKLKPDLAQARKFLDTLDPKGEFTFQTFDGDKDRKDNRLARTFHGTFDMYVDTLVSLNSHGAGVFVTINKTDLNGRSKQNITEVRSVFVDLDGAPLEPVINHQLEPHIIVESSPNRWHAYWLCQLPLGEFTSIQKVMASIFNGDMAVNDLPRVMRLPGFIHEKTKKGERTEPFITSLEQVCPDSKPYDREEIIEHFPPLETRTIATVPEEEKEFLPVSEEKIRDMLQYLNPENREQWISIGHALKAINDDYLSIFLEFSRGDLTGTKPSNFLGDRDVIKTWYGFSPNRTGFGALQKMAAKAGYKPSLSSGKLKTGSQVEIASLLKEMLMDQGYSEIVFDEGYLWGFDKTHWKQIPEEDIRKLIHQFDGIKFRKSKIALSKNFIDGVINEFSVMSTVRGFFENALDGVNLSNGFVQIHRDGSITTIDHHADHRQRFLLNFSFVPNLTTEWHGLLGTLFNGCFGEDHYELSKVIIEIFGCAICGISTKITSPQAFIFHGQSAANGKSQMQAILREILPHNITCSIPPADLDKEQYLAKLIGRQANLSDEISGSKEIASDKFKAVITGDPVTAKIIYREPIEFAPRALHLLSTNTLPSFKGGVDSGIERRLTVIPFNRTIPVNERVPEIAKRIVAEEGNILVSEAIRAAAEVFKNGAYSIPEISGTATQQWLLESDVVKQWIESGRIDHHITRNGVLLQELYLEFRKEMQEEGVTHIPFKRRFNSSVREFVSKNPCWEQRHTAQGDKVFPSDLVTKMKNIS